MKNLYLENLGKVIVIQLCNTLDRAGIMYRVFYRVKTTDSIEKKIVSKNYGENGKKLTDILGIRFNLYFKDDVNILYDFLKKDIFFDHESKENHTPQEFKPERLNLTFKFNPEQTKEFSALMGEQSNKIDNTYEIQLRTVLSEGWHEVEHDLRYKCDSDWIGHDDLLRNLNGLLATLETSDFTMLKIFDTLSHRHYKNGNLSGLIKTKFRLRLKTGDIDLNIINHFKENPLLLKGLIKLDRDEFVEKLLHSRVAVPLTINNLIQILNQIYFHDDKITNFANDFIIDDIQEGLIKK